MRYSPFVLFPGCTQKSTCINICYHQPKSPHIRYNAAILSKVSIKNRSTQRKNLSIVWRKGGNCNFPSFWNCFLGKSRNIFCILTAFPIVSHYQLTKLVTIPDVTALTKQNLTLVLYYTKWSLLKKHARAGVIYSLAIF